MQPAHGPLSEAPRGDVPLPPVLTRHTPASGPAEAETLVAPFVAGLARATPPPQRPVAEAAIEPTFPLDAFILPPDALVARPVDAQRELAVAAAERLEALAARLRAEGFDALLAPGADARQIDLLLASLLAGYVAR